MPEPILVDPESKVTLQVLAFQEERTLLPGTTGDGQACFVQEGDVRHWLILDAPGPSSVAFKVQVPSALYEAVVEAIMAQAREA